tara:strand:- start:4128 stop:5033 length:906 start_codon:yes stop_codon:yes gene_type:complete
MLVENGFSYQAVAEEMDFEPELRQSIPIEWREWLDENISKNQNQDGLFKVLLMHGFSFDAIKSQMNYEPSIPLCELEDPFKRRNVFGMANIDSTKGKTYGEKPLIVPNAVKLDTDKLEIFYIDNFLSNDECRHLIKAIRSKLRPSKLTSPDNDKFFRTSKTCDLAELNDEIIQNIDNKICDLLLIEKNLSEPIQGQYYEVGQEFKPHTDFFEDHELKLNGGALGQRSYTVMIYLNATEQGGETTFPLIDEEFSPSEGKAIIWCNLNTDFSPNLFSIHHAKQVRKGYKAIITKWFRTGIPIT